MKLMTSHISATARLETPHVNQTTRTNTIVNGLKRRAQSVLNDKSIDAQTKGLFVTLQSFETNEDDPSEEKITALAAMICRAGDESATKSAALLVLMARFENAAHPKAVVNRVKHLAFTRCGELNFCGMVEAQIAV
jgi:hypothetical protein